MIRLSVVGSWGGRVLGRVGGQFLSQHIKSGPPTEFSKKIVWWVVVVVVENDFSFQFPPPQGKVLTITMEGGGEEYPCLCEAFI